MSNTDFKRTNRQQNVFFFQNKRHDINQRKKKKSTIRKQRGKIAIGAAGAGAAGIFVAYKSGRKRTTTTKDAKGPKPQTKTEKKKGLMASSSEVKKLSKVKNTLRKHKRKIATGATAGVAAGVAAAGVAAGVTYKALSKKQIDNIETLTNRQEQNDKDSTILHIALSGQLSNKVRKKLNLIIDELITERDALKQELELQITKKND